MTVIHPVCPVSLVHSFDHLSLDNFFNMPIPIYLLISRMLQLAVPPLPVHKLVLLLTWSFWSDLEMNILISDISPCGQLLLDLLSAAIWLLITTITPREEWQGNAFGSHCQDAYSKTILPIRLIFLHKKYNTRGSVHL